MENMTLLDFARGPGLQWALWIFCLGILWRIVGAMFLLGTKDLSKARRKHSIRDGLRAIATRSAPAEAFEDKIRFQHISGYAWHLALFVSVLFFAPHILFFESLFGFSWPHLPNTIILFSGAVAGAKIKGAARDLAVAMRESRSRAILSGSEQQLSLNLGQGHYVAGNNKSEALPAEMTIDIQQITGAHVEDDEEYVLRFFADGSTSGELITLKSGNRAYRLQLDWLTGAITIQEGQGGAG